MRRTYTPVSFERRVEAVLKVRSDVFLGTDVMTGFPGETEEDFRMTKELCRRLGIANIHAFRYSRRDGTPAATMKGAVDGRVVRSRMEELREIRAEGFRRYVQSETGRVRTVVLEDEKEGFARGLSENFLRVHLPPIVGVKGSVVRVRIEGLDQKGRVIGSRVSQA